MIIGTISSGRWEQLIPSTSLATRCAKARTPSRTFPSCLFPTTARSSRQNLSCQPSQPTAEDANARALHLPDPRASHGSSSALVIVHDDKRMGGEGLEKSEGDGDGQDDDDDDLMDSATTKNRSVSLRPRPRFQRPMSLRDQLFRIRAKAPTRMSPSFDDRIEDTRMASAETPPEDIWKVFVIPHDDEEWR